MSLWLILTAFLVLLGYVLWLRWRVVIPALVLLSLGTLPAIDLSTD